MYSDLKQTAIDAALAAGKLLKQGFGAVISISNKDGINNIVTDYDYRSQELIINMIKRQFPGHLFLAEEEDGDESLSNQDLKVVRSQFSGLPDDTVKWIVDPLDGTVNFAHKIPIFSVSIAAELKGEIIVGVIYNPMLNELFVASKGGGAYLNGELINVSSCTSLVQSILVTGFPYNVKDNPEHCIDHFVNLIKMGIPVRRLGSAALDLAYLAAGRFDGFWEVNLHPWDVAAGLIILLEAGGRATRFDNIEYKITDNNILATNGYIHNEFSNVLMMGKRYNF
jgi:myo-inositol-1(or 4)-monophosphatase